MLKTAVRHHRTPVRAGYHQQGKKDQCWRLWRKGTPLCSAECELVQPLGKAVWKFLKKKINGFAICYLPMSILAVSPKKI
jgi:hypothetical protein